MSDANIPDRIERRVKNVEEAIQLLTEAALRADERADTHQEWLNQLGAGQSNLEVKLAALTDAQIRTEDALKGIRESQAHLIEEQAGLAESQKRLTESQERLSEAQARLTEDMARLAKAQERLAESQAHSDKRLDALIDIISEGRDGKTP